MKKVILTGATGMVGKGVLLECLDHRAIGEVLVIGRNPVSLKHPKLKELIHSDFNDFNTASIDLKGYDACFFCMGVSAAGLNEDQYKQITYAYTLSLAKVLHRMNPAMIFNYVSGQGTDTTEKGRMMWARVKGKTENDLIQLGFRRAYMFRPGAIIPLRGIKSRTKSYQFIYDHFMWLVKLIRLISPDSVVTTTQIGQAMINTVLQDYEKQILKPRDILALASKSQ
ncbi:MAG: epimerase [Lentimicrobiaceae bacterium]|nr:epimerase [Lentimicrobiaceae bacterium]